MGGFISIAVIAIVIIVVVRHLKRQKAIQELKDSKAYELALLIKDELISKGYQVKSGDWLEDPLFYDGMAVGLGYVSSDSDSGGRILFTAYRSALFYSESDTKLRNARAGRRCFYAIKNDNISILVTSSNESQEMPPFIEIAAEVIKNNGYGSCTLID